MSFQHTMPGRWVDSDESAQTTTTTTTTIPYSSSLSTTLDEDKSQPPTPDGTGLPTNFHLIGPGIYRSSYPQPAHFSALLPYHFKTIVTLVPDPLPAANLAFLSAHSITHHHIPVLANKTPHLATGPATVIQILSLITDKSRHPILIHCNKGKHRTGCMVACFRKLTGWTDEACIAEYERYAAPKDRVLDKEFIRGFEVDGLVELKAWALENGLVGGAFAQSRGGSEYTVGTGWSEQSRG